ncbi:putative glycosyltransferase [Streptomyces sparsogenes DSM 40356]|uniref:D-inositol 3-phosphate glycosyltransferase n=2 Tax=Streptomyces sparsogenes TaxID=67365 RepID=A0A1R1SMZ9_9ACTN|nr:glycosyltransferase family 4 protein [Streptomyces sparsogenes]OMI39369.1 putative glycosyltransferase [Streptomyces sparsogenes DSM 40356]
MKISFLLQNAFGIGGTIRSTFNLAGALAARHDVQIVSVLRTQDQPRLTLARKVRLHSLIDRRESATASGPENALFSAPSVLVPDPEAADAQFNRLTDQRVAEHLAQTDADVVVATRPGLVLYLAESGRGRYARIGQEHRIYDTHGTGAMRTALDEAIARLDAFVAVSEADAAIHRAHLAHASTRINGIPNAVPAPGVERSTGTTKLVVAAGRLVPVKRYELLVEAFAKVASERPDWRLRIYGRGPERQRLRTTIDELGLSDHVSLMGAHSPIETEWAKGSIAAVTSDEESFGMTIVEAMHCGVPVVATDCPHGPGEIITDGEDGLLVPVGDTDAIASALLGLINDDERRTAMGESAQSSALRYAPRTVASAYEALFTEVLKERESAMAELTRRLRRGVGRLIRPAHRLPAESPQADAPTTTSGRASLGPLRPTASCRITVGGDLHVRLNDSGLSGEDLSLILRRRGGEELLRTPLQPPATGADKTQWTALFPRSELLHLAEGRWDFRAERADDGTGRRVTAHLVEQRGLLTYRPRPNSPFSWCIPYRTSDGYLALRTWHRTAHAEADTLRVGHETLTIHGTLYGAEFTSTAALAGLAVSRAGNAHNFTADVDPLDRTRFRLTVSYARALAALSGDRDVWDLALRLAPGSEPVRIGRILGDLVERKKVDSHPPSVLDSPGRGPTRFKPFFTVTNDLAISAADLAETE